MLLLQRDASHVFFMKFNYEALVNIHEVGFTIKDYVISEVIAKGLFGRTFVFSFHFHYFDNESIKIAFGYLFSF